MQNLPRIAMEELIKSRFFCCFKCRNVVAYRDDIIDKNYIGRRGRAFLLSHAMNLREGPKVDRRLITGMYMVADVYCSDCNEKLGWNYKGAHQQQNMFKVGKFVLEKFKIIKADDQSLNY